MFLPRVRGSRQDHLFFVQIATTKAVRRQVQRVWRSFACVYACARVLCCTVDVFISVAQHLQSPALLAASPDSPVLNPAATVLHRHCVPWRAENMQNTAEGIMVLAGGRAESAVL